MTTPQGTSANFGGDRRPALYGTLITFLVLNNLAVAARIVAHYRAYYRIGGRIFLEDVFVLLSGACVNVVIGNLLASTHYGLGLHSWRINAEDPYMPRNMSNIFKHVWLCMVFVGPTFTFIKLSLLFFYRRLFLVNQKRLRIAWWANMVYVILWFFGATGFYIFQCWPVQWYWTRYYQRYHGGPLIANKGQCNATTVAHVAMPLILGLISDVALLLLPLAAISKLQISLKKKLGLAAIFSVGALACLLELARIIELEVDTDDQKDPSYGVVVFLILSVAEEVCAIICASLPVVIPQLLREYRREHSSQKMDHSYSTKLGAVPQSRSMIRGFQKLGEGSCDQTYEGQNLAGEQTSWACGSIPLNTVVAETPPQTEDPGDTQIVVKREYEVTVGGSNSHAV